MKQTLRKTLSDAMAGGKYTPGFQSTPNTGVIENLIRFRSFVKKMEEVNGLGEFVQKIQQSPIFQTAEDMLELRTSEAMAILSLAHALIGRAEAIKNALENEEQPENCVYIKLPDENDLQQMVSNLDRFRMALSQTILNKEIKGKLQVENWESGSFWLTVCVGSAVAVAVIGSLAWAAAVVTKKIQEAKIFNEFARGLSIKNDSLEDLKHGQDKMIDLMLANEAKHIEVEFYPDSSDPEQTERLKHAINTFSDLIQRGAEVHPALNAPEQVSNLFPNFQNLLAIQSKVKQITETAGKE